MQAGKQAGYGYLGLLAALAVLSIMMYRLGDDWRVRDQRAKEAQLLFAGAEIRAAIGRYFDRGPVQGCYPPDLEALLEDRREQAGGAMRIAGDTGDRGRSEIGMEHGAGRGAATGRGAALLRRLYRDPLTGSTRWGEIRDPAGALIGVFSLGNGRPFRQDNFPEADAAFAGKQDYREWRFIHEPQVPPAPARSCGFQSIVEPGSAVSTPSGEMAHARVEGRLEPDESGPGA
jgi:type II secretory pathway pseudopilin PulG